MKGKLLIVYFLIPALVLGMLVRDGSDLSISEWLYVILANYFIFSLPHISWLGIAKIREVRLATWHAGFIGANLALVGLFALFECCLDNENALGWAYYYPVAFVSVVLFVSIASLFGNADERAA